MAACDFDYILEKMTPLIRKQDTFMRKTIIPIERLVVTLRFLATSKYKLIFLFNLLYITYIKKIS